jgi:hypothetical protein
MGVLLSGLDKQLRGQTIPSLGMIKSIAVLSQWKNVDRDLSVLGEGAAVLDRWEKQLLHLPPHLAI